VGGLLTLANFTWLPFPRQNKFYEYSQSKFRTFPDYFLAWKYNIEIHIKLNFITQTVLCNWPLKGITHGISNLVHLNSGCRNWIRKTH